VPPVGVDEWAARVEERREQRAGLMGQALAAWDRVAPVWRLVLFAALVASVPCLNDSDFIIRVGVNTLLLAMLALGLNIVVGWAGLLDLGYIAFYGFGAYTYALLASDQIDVHLASWLTIVCVVVACAVLGFLLGLPSRRLIGDYLAIVTLFFGQVFVEVVTNLDRVTLPGKDEPVDITGGPNGIAGVDPIQLFGIEFLTPTDYFYLSLVVLVILIAVLYLIDNSRTGRAWRAIREDPLAAGLMTMPVKRLKLMAFAFGAAVAGLAGAIFAALQIGVFPRNFETPFLILIYAAVILGGAGSIKGMLAGAAVVGISFELLREPDEASWIFYGGVLLALVLTVRPWRLLAAVLAGVVALGLALHAVVGGLWPDAVAGSPRADWALSSAIDNWLLFPEDPKTIGNWAFVALVVAVVWLSQAGRRARLLALVPLVYLAAFVWENRLMLDPSVTRQLMLGALLIVVMILRPAGLFGAKRIEVA
jgi:ABC-type branched-subunit amino acid transport system permease subunit